VQHVQAYSHGSVDSSSAIFKGKSFHHGHGRSAVCKSKPQTGETRRCVRFDSVKDTVCQCEAIQSVPHVWEGPKKIGDDLTCAALVLLAAVVGLSLVAFAGCGGIVGTLLLEDPSKLFETLQLLAGTGCIMVTLSAACLSTSLAAIVQTTPSR